MGGVEDVDRQEVDDGVPHSASQARGGAAQCLPRLPQHQGAAACRAAAAAGAHGGSYSPIGSLAKGFLKRTLSDNKPSRPPTLPIFDACDKNPLIVSLDDTMRYNENCWLFWVGLSGCWPSDMNQGPVCAIIKVSAEPEPENTLIFPGEESVGAEQ